MAENGATKLMTGDSTNRGDIALIRLDSKCTQTFRDILLPCYGFPGSVKTH